MGGVFDMNVSMSNRQWRVFSKPVQEPRRNDVNLSLRHGQSPRFGGNDTGSYAPNLHQCLQQWAIRALTYLKTLIGDLLQKLVAPLAKGETRVLHKTKFLEMCEYQSPNINHPWIYVRSPIAKGAVVVVPVKNDKLILIEQKRPPLEHLDGQDTKGVIELPAGLIGDESDRQDENAIQAAKTELLEETGYKAKSFTYLGKGATSPGMSNEVVQYVKAENLKRVSKTLGTESEAIVKVHQVPLKGIQEWLKEKQNEGYVINCSVYSGLGLLNK